MISKPSILDDYLELVTYGFTNPMPDAEEGPWKITAKDVINGQINFSTARKTTQDAFDTKLTKKSRPKVGDVLLTKDGTLGRLAIVRQEGICINQSVAVLRANEKILPEYLFYLLSTPEYQRKMIGDSDGTVIKHIYITRVGKMEVNIPPIEEQKEILKHLVTIDKKINLNDGINKTLEQIAQAIFKSWFVAFEPVKAKISAREALLTDIPTATAEQIRDAEQQAAIKAISGAGNVVPTEQLQTLADLFPNQLVESELGEIPEGWEVVDIKSISNKISKGTTPRKKDMQEAEDPASIKFLKVRDIADNGDINASSLDLIPNSVHTGAIKRSILVINDVIFSIAGTIGRVSVIGEELANANCNQAVAFIRLTEPEQYKDFLYLLLKTSEVQDLVESKVVQGVQANFSLTELGNIQFAKCDCELLEHFNKVVGNLFSEKQTLSRNTATLVNLRDTLLPKLLSGEIELLNKEVV